MLSNASTLNQVASKYDVTPQSILTWKKQFLENASLAFDVSGATKAYKDEIEELKESNDKLAKALGNTTIERDWAMGKLKSLDLLSKKSLIDSQAQDLSLSCSKAEFRSKARTKQCKLLKVSRSSLYYKPKPMSETNHSILNAMDEIYTDNPEYGYRYIHRQLKEDGFVIGKHRVLKYMNILGIEAIFPRAKKLTSIKEPEHKIYPYLLKEYKNKYDEF